MMPTNVLYCQVLGKIKKLPLVNIITYIFEWFENIVISRTLKNIKYLSFTWKYVYKSEKTN